MYKNKYLTFSILEVKLVHVNFLLYIYSVEYKSINFEQYIIMFLLSVRNEMFQNVNFLFTRIIFLFLFKITLFFIKIFLWCELIIKNTMINWFDIMVLFCQLYHIHCLNAFVLVIIACYKLITETFQFCLRIQK